MQIPHLSLLHLMSLEYNEIINSTTINTTPPNADDYNDYSESISARLQDTDEIDFELAEIELEMLVLLNSSARKRAHIEDIDTGPRKRSKRGKYNMRKLYFTNPTTGERQPFTYKYSVWYSNYIEYPQENDKKWSKLFRNRFRMPYSAFLDLVNGCKGSDYFVQWQRGKHKYNKQENYPISLLVLTALRYMGRGWTLDDLQENTAVSRETIRIFFLKFIEFGSTSLYNKFVNAPNNLEALRDCEHEYSMAGFAGCIGSTDASHIIHEKCSYRLRQLHLGYKMSLTARTYNITVNHRRRVLGTTKGHPARFNDKTLVLFDEFIQNLRKKKYDDVFTFMLKDYDSQGNIIDVKYRGCYVIVDNGYLPWSVTVPPYKECDTRSATRFSEWLESLRKDVECTFGILKGRWRILKTGIRMHGLLTCDRIWLTCVALHNMLLEVDGLAEKWDDGVQSDFQRDEQDDSDLPFSIRRLESPTGTKVYDFSGMGQGNDCISCSDNETGTKEDCETEENVTINDDGSINVSDLSLKLFREKLVIHFNILFLQNKIQWPKRNTNCN